ncbi:rRNA methylase [Cyanobium sp. Copco_Reservoir_LC18]|uniref:23S rRNA (guanosine(2251)-2'-O)-methyltransferase RlmB n=1 Tax=Cyanobium sp. Copco_Reservoir_LC18 TaxID=1328305 RepID=UPI001358D14F|nr:23S rRNA (guanosine(2251)-2'-O)-methyltransferase RlmB [Cyanobium sp. Copco_Reservoir_LC18]KAF0653974.1 rRNA methylase [Cyanobium sp. Copco_Reservoir_LC18]
MSPSPDRRGDRRPDRRPDRRSDPGADRTPRRLGSGAGGRPVSRGAASSRPRRPGDSFGRARPSFDRDRGLERGGERGSERGGDRAGAPDRGPGSPYGRRPFDGRPGADGPGEFRGGSGRPTRERRPGDRFSPARPSFGRPVPGRGGAGRPSPGRPSPTRSAPARRGPALFRDADRAPRPFQGRTPERAESDGSDVDFRGAADAFAAAAPSDLIWGRHSTQATLESGRPIHRVWCTPEMRFSPRFLQLLREAKASGVLVEEVTWARLGQLTGGAVHQGIVLQPAAAETLDLTSLIEGCRSIGEAPLLIAVDGLTDPQNLGAIVRSAEALGAHGMVLPQRRNAGLTGSVAKVAAGALEHLPVARVVNLNRSLDALKQEGYRVVGLAEEGTVSLEEVDLEGPLVVVTGSEGDGLSLLTRRSCDQLVRIPLRGATPSLNASVATALLLYEVARRGWMRGLRGAAPAPRIVRPSMPAPPDPEPETLPDAEVGADAESHGDTGPEESLAAEAADTPLAALDEPLEPAEPVEAALEPVDPAAAEPTANPLEPLPYLPSPQPGFDGDIRL